MDKPPHSDNLSERVRSEMEEAFLSGALVPGQVLDERSLAERFGVSRTPVREAVQSLASSGLLKVVSRVGIVVPKLTIKDLLALLEILAELEGICASFAARRMSAKERQLLREAMTACETAADKGDVAAYESANRAFHAAIYAGARNEWAAAQIRTLRLRSAKYQRARFELAGRTKHSLGGHHAILAAIESGESEEARRAMLEHMSSGGRDFAELVSTLEPHLLAGEQTTTESLRWPESRPSRHRNTTRVRRKRTPKTAK